jgi:hypothetical protein
LSRTTPHRSGEDDAQENERDHEPELPERERRRDEGDDDQRRERRALRGFLP